MNIDSNKIDLIQVVRSTLGVDKPKMKLQFVTTIYFNTKDFTEAKVAGELAAERIEQFSPDCKISDVKTEQIGDPEDEIKL